MVLLYDVHCSAASIKANLHLFDHTIKPIVLYGSEIWEIFKTNSVACKKNAIKTDSVSSLLK
jgi:hypothetical protein